MTTYILDTETTGLMAGKDQVIQLAYLEVPSLDKLEQLATSIKSYGNHVTSTFKMDNRYFCPTVPISAKAFEVHGLSVRRLLQYESSHKAKIPDDATLIIGHNINFDHRMLGKPEVQLLCTLQLMKKLRKQRLVEIPETYNNTLDVLTSYFYGTEYDFLTKNLHDALLDCFKVVLLLKTICRYLPAESFQDLINYGEK